MENGRSAQGTITSTTAVRFCGSAVVFARVGSCRCVPSWVEEELQTFQVPTPCFRGETLGTGRAGLEGFTLCASTGSVCFSAN